MTAKLSGPAGGEWVHVVATGRDVPTRCDECGDLTHDSWQWYVGLISHARLCAACVNELTAAVVVSVTPKEEVMASTAGITPDHLTEIALALEAAHLDWEQGRATSPDTRDYVLITERIVADRIGPEYLWLSDATTESVAEALYEAQCDGETLSEWADMAEWLATAVTVGHDEGVA